MMLTREQVSNLLIVGDVPYGNAHRLVLAHDAEQRQTIERLESIIKQHDLCHDLHGKVGRDEFEEGCRRETVKQYGSCGWKETIETQAQRIAELEAALKRHQEEP